MFPRTQNSYTNSARCSLCETASLTNFPTLLQHIKGRKHTSKVKNTVEDFRHPKIKSPGKFNFLFYLNHNIF